MLSIYERIEKLIKAKGITKKSFCQQLGISTGNLGDWKRGKSTPSSNKLIEIAAFFDVSLDWLMVGKEREPSIVREESVEYTLKQLTTDPVQLTREEENFIREYLEFVQYRRQGKRRDTAEITTDSE